MSSIQQERKVFLLVVYDHQASQSVIGSFCDFGRMNSKKMKLHQSMFLFYICILLLLIRPWVIQSFLMNNRPICTDRVSSSSSFYDAPSTFSQRIHSTTASTCLHLVSNSTLSVTNNTPRSSNSLLHKLLSWFQGDFDNYNQVLHERQVLNMTLREGGGHEHIHCTLVPLQVSYFPPHMFQSSDSYTQNTVREACRRQDDDSSSASLEQEEEQDRGVVLAVYYLDGQPHRIFRIRLYTIFQNHHHLLSSSSQPTPKDDVFVRMKLYMLHPQLEAQIRQCSNVAQWTSRVYQFMSQHTMDTSRLSSIDANENFQALQNCDILWMSQPDPLRHGYLSTNSSNPQDCIETISSKGIHAYMMYDFQNQGVLVNSQTTPGLKIRIQDELSLWGNHLWINDRGYPEHSNTFIYGNWKGIPYKLERVSTFRTILQAESVMTSDNRIQDRQVINPSLEWTLQREH